jgi:hypothetical protein
MQKVCSQCAVKKPIAEFHKKAAHSDGLRSECKACHKKHGAAYYKANKEKIIFQSTAYAKSNPEVRAAIAKRYREKYPERWAEQSRRWREANPGMAAANYRKNKYGSDGAELLIAQKYKCAICTRDLKTIHSRHCHLDHCHTKRQVRGWLCNDCNRGLGGFKDDPKRLRAAIKYLSKAHVLHLMITKEL